MSKDWGIVVVAAGSGTRFGGQIPKQYAPLGGKPVLGWSLETLKDQGEAVIVADPSHAPFYKDLLKNHVVVAGGATRQASVLNGLKAFKTKPRYVLIHDAARPFLPARSLPGLKKAIEKGRRSATLSVPIADTLMRGSEVVDRKDLHAIQTPQAFEYDLLLQAHEKASRDYTDDTSLVFGECGVATTFVPGCPDNFKLTTADELQWAEKLLMADFETRTGLGLDFHRFGPGDMMRLFGIDISAKMALIGHSDADAGLHAIADAILGTIGAGDIGILFSPSDPSLKGMDSARIVEKALELLHARGGKLVNVDIMLMAEFPRIGAHRDAITKRLCEILNLPADAIGLKATTTEQMGFIGRGEGLAVQAIVSVKVKK